MSASDVQIDFSRAIERIIQHCGDDISVVLIGSAARGKQTVQSDIDLLVLSLRQCRVHVSGFHIQIQDEGRFTRNLAEGEDFEAWCVKFGKPLYGAERWELLVRSAPTERMPKWEIKVVHGARRLFIASSLLDVGDLAAAAEELLYALGHAARGLLLKAGIFPLSRPELAQQVSDLGYAHLAVLHEDLRRGVKSESVLRIAKLYSKKLLCHLDREIYKKSAQDHSETQKTKRKKRSIGH